MSRIGKKAIPVPSGVQVKVESGQVRIKGPKGELTGRIENGIDVKLEDGNLIVSRQSDDRLIRAKHGLTRAILSNMVIGVSQGYQKTLEMTGVGYRAQAQGRNLTLALGFSHPVIYTLRAGIEVSVEKQTMITIKGADKYWVGQVAAEIRHLKPPEPYKGKGIKYSGERIVRKEGKTGK